MLTKSAANCPAGGATGRRPAAAPPPSGAARGRHGGPRRGRGRPAGEELRGARGTKPAPPWRVVAGRAVAAAARQRRRPQSLLDPLSRAKKLAAGGLTAPPR